MNKIVKQRNINDVNGRIRLYSLQKVTIIIWRAQYDFHR